MVLDLVVTKTSDGYTSEVPSLKGCESWAHGEDEAIEKAIELVRFYTNLPEDNEIIIDRSYKQGNSIIYKLAFEKEN